MMEPTRLRMRRQLNDSFGDDTHGRPFDLRVVGGELSITREVTIDHHLATRIAAWLGENAEAFGIRLTDQPSIYRRTITVGISAR